jgi:hypothetical protein
MANPMDKINDHEDDITYFEICIINKMNQGMILFCMLNQAEIKFQCVQNISSDALKICSMSQTQRNFYKNENGLSWRHMADSHGPKWNFLSENLQ